MSVDLAGVYSDDTRPIDIGIFNRVCDELVHQQAQRNGLVRGYDDGIRTILKPVFRRRTLKISAKMLDEIGKIDESDLATAPEMIMHFRDRSDTHGGVFQCVLHIDGIRPTCLHT